MQIFVSLMSSRCLLNYLHFFFSFFSSCFFSELVISTTLSSTSLIFCINQFANNFFQCIKKKIQLMYSSVLFGSLYFLSSVQLLSPVRLFETPWTAACQASLSITNSRSLLKVMSVESVMPSNHLILCCPLLPLPSLFPSIRVFLMSQVFTSGGQS